MAATPQRPNTVRIPTAGRPSSAASYCSTLSENERSIQDPDAALVFSHKEAGVNDPFATTRTLFSIDQSSATTVAASPALTAQDMEARVPEAHTGTLRNATRKPVLDKILKCPFGDDFQPLEKAESSIVFSSESLQSHVADYMKELALLTLQKLPSDDDENAEDVNSDHSLEDDGPGGAFGIIRASMNNILDNESLGFHDRAGVADGNLGHREEDIAARVTELALDDKNDLGRAKLHYAEQAGDLGLVECLLQSGASANYRDENGQTPLHYAAGEGLHRLHGDLAQARRGFTYQ